MMKAKEQALDALSRTAAEMAAAAQEHLDRGAHPEAVALGLARMNAGLKPEVVEAQMAALVTELPAERRAAVVVRIAGQVPAEQVLDALSEEEQDRLFAEMQARRAARQADTSSKPPSS